jgi:transcriptional regulator with XRE-family HTH domain
VPTPRRERKLIGEAVRKYRKQAKLTQEKLAEKADLHPVYVGEVERGEQTVSVHALMRLANVLRVRVRDLVADL